MKKLLSFLILLASVASARADFPDSGVVRRAGAALETSNVSCSSFTATQIFVADPWDANADIMNNSAFTLWIGSNTNTLFFTGFPILASTTYTLDGRFTGSIYGMVESGASANQSVRIIRYKVPAPVRP